MTQRTSTPARQLVAALVLLPLLVVACGDADRPAPPAGGGGTAKSGTASVLAGIPLASIAEKAAAEPERFAPAWPAGKAAAYTIAGAAPEDGAESAERAPFALFGPDGSVEAPVGAPNAVIWVYDAEEDRLHAPGKEGAAVTLPDGYLPFPRARWKAGPAIEVRTQVVSVAAGEGEEPLFQYRTTLFNTGPAPREARICLVFRPATLHGGEPAGTALTLDGRDLLDDGSLLCRCAAGAKGLVAIPPAAPGMAPAHALCYDVTLAATPGEFASAAAAADLSFLFPAGAPPARWPEGKELRKRFAESHLAWKDGDCLDRIGFISTDAGLETAWRAALGRLVLAARPEGLGAVPGPGRSFRCIETAAAAAALNRAGRPGEARTLLTSFSTVLRRDGGIPLFAGAGREDGARNARGDGAATAESNGRALFALVDHYRFTADRAWLEGMKETILTAADFLAAKMAGGLPDRYADGHWALIGLEESAYAADALGLAEKAGSYRKEGARLRTALGTSIPQTMKDAGASYLPVTRTVQAAPPRPGETLAAAAAAWPGTLLNHRISRDARSIELFWDLWFEGSQGGMRTADGFLTAGMEIGSPLMAMRLRKYPDLILEWHAQHTTLRGASTWAACLPAPDGTAGDPEGTGLAPSLRADAAYVTLMRNLYVMERSGYLFLFPGIRLRWFDMEDELAIINAPTQYGTISFRIATVDKRKTVIDFFDTTATPPKGYMMNQIIPSSNPTIRVDGARYSHATNDYLLILPARAKRIEIDW